MKSLSYLAAYHFFLLLITCNSTIAQTSPLTFSEVMFTPSESNGEFIEIYNTSSTETVDLSGYKIKYYTSSNTSLTPVSGGTNLLPGKFAILLQGSYDLVNGIYKSLIPANTVILKTGGNYFGSSGMANTSDRQINLLNPSGQAIDTYTYSANNSAGYSDEKIEMTKDNSSANWGNAVIMHGTPGFRNSISPVDYDLSVSFNKQSPLLPHAEDSVYIQAVIKNLGRKDARNFVVNIYDNVDGDLVAEPDELVLTKTFLLLAPKDSLVVEYKHYIDSAGTYSFIAEAVYDNDENILNNKSELKFSAVEKPAEPFEIIINEFMYMPSGDEPEWIEIYNRSNRTLNLKNWKIGDASSAVTISNIDLVLNPGEFLLVSDDESLKDYYLLTSRVITKSLPSLNNSGDEIILYDNYNTRIDSVKYISGWGNLTGKSLERINYDSTSTSPSNWKNSIGKLNATPGSKNSVIPLNHDLTVSFLPIVPGNPAVEDSVELKIVIKNIGKQSAQNFYVNVYDDKNVDSLGQGGEIIISNFYPGLEIKDSINIVHKFVIQSVAAFSFVVETVYELDENISNNSAVINFGSMERTAGSMEVVINEFNYAPSVNEPEWIEIVNNSGRNINLKDWKICDNSSSVTLSNVNIYMSPYEYVVISNDSSAKSIYKLSSRLIVIPMPALNNNGDEIVLKNNINVTIDSVKYNPQWGGSNGVSLERIAVDDASIDEINWNRCISGKHGTPGRINSVSKKEYDLYLIRLKSNYEYVENGKSLSIIAEIKNDGTEAAFDFSIKIFADLNKNNLPETSELLTEKKQLIQTKGSNYEYEFPITGLEIGKNKIIALTDFRNDQYNDNDTSRIDINVVQINEVRGDLVVNEIMYAPAATEPEWIEIFNNSEKEINLLGYSIADNSNKYKIVSTSFIVEPGSFVVFALDSAIFLNHPGIQNVIVAELPGLNNLGDRIMLCDSLGRTIDSLEYKSAWGGLNGKSLERIDPSRSSTDSTNWKTSTSQNGGTPSKINSVTKKNYDAAITKLICNPAKPGAGEDVFLSAEIINYGKAEMSCVIVLYEILELGIKKIVENSPELKLIPRSSDVYSFSYIIHSINSRHSLTAELVSITDEDSTNNYKSLEIVPGYPHACLLINEIMFNPVDGEPEWIELYNNSMFDVNLSGWSITDLFTAPVKTKIKYDVIVHSKSYCVISKDTSIIYFHKVIPAAISIVEFANMNNDKDGIVIKDYWDSAIDSVQYDKTWGGESGRSIERKSLNGLSVDKLNWASSTDIELSTPGRINSVSQKEFDLGVTKFFCREKYIEEGKTAALHAAIENIGVNAAGNFKVKLFADRNKNSIGEPDEFLYEKEMFNLSPGGITNVELNVSGFESGRNQFILILEYNEDQSIDNNKMECAVACVKINEFYNDIVINEIMFAPAAPEPEWIEIFNKSSKKINLLGYCIAVETNKNKIVQTPFFIAPGEYAVIARDSSIFQNHPDLKNLIVSSFPLLNNSHNKILLNDSLGRTIDSLEYKSQWGGTNGKSLERIDRQLSSTDSTNWKTSASPVGSTPSKINSVSQKNFNGAVAEILFIPNQPTAGDEVKIKSGIENIGKNDVSLELILYETEFNGSKQILEKTSLLTVKAGEYFLYEFNYVLNSIYSTHTFQVELVLTGDEDLANNSATASINPAYFPGTIKINEVMYCPVNGEPEWIELFNDSDVDINLGCWSVSDVLTTPLEIKIKPVNIPAKSFLVIAKDSSVINYHTDIHSNLSINNFANLNNDADGVVIKDYWGNVIDSLLYDKTWGGTDGKSLERKSLSKNSTDKNNWGTSVDIEFSTPGRINSTSQKYFDLAIINTGIVPELPLFDEDVSFFAWIKNAGTKTATNFDVKFFFVNETDTVLFNSVLVESLKSLDSVKVFSSIKSKLTVSKNVVCKIYFPDDQDVSNNILSSFFQAGSKRNDVSISEIMFNPLDGESEWIEIVNNSPFQINLKNWIVSDPVTHAKAVISKQDRFLNPGEYAVITQDTSKFPYYPPENIFEVNFGSLGNSIDGIIIFDCRNTLIDSIEYNSRWGGAKGFSIERISLNGSCSDSTNWSTSLCKEGATPGTVNSITKVCEYPSGTLIINEIMFDPEVGSSEFVEIYNASVDSVEIGGMYFEIGQSKICRISPHLNIVTPNNCAVLACDSLIENIFPSLHRNGTRLFVNKSLGLSNEGAMITLRNFNGRVLDSLVYSQSWHNKNITNTKNKSLEKIHPMLNSNNPANWSTCVGPEGATPGMKNSIFVQDLTGVTKVSIHPNPFSPDNDGHEDFAAIDLNIAKKISQVRIKVFDSIGRLVRTIADNIPAASKNTIIFNGLDDNGRALRIGIYILLIEIVADDGSIETLKSPVVVARKL